MAAEAAPVAGQLGLSEAWAVEDKHVGCFTGGKICWSEAAQVLGCLCSDQLHLVDVAAQSPTRHVSQEGDAILTFAVDPTGQNACTSHSSGLLRHFRLGQPVTLVRSWKAHEQLVADVCFDASGGLVASGSVDRTVKVWDFSGYFCTHNFRGHSALVSIVRFHPARLQLVSVADTEVRLWDLETSSCMGLMKDHLTSISSLCFGKVGAGVYQLVTGGRDQVVNVWRLEDRCALMRSVPVFENVEGVAAVPTKGFRQALPEGSAGKEPFVQWLQGSAKLPPYVFLTVGDKGVLRAWNPSDGKCVGTKASPHAAKGALRQVHCLDQAGGQKIVTVGEDQNLVIWSLPEFQVVSYIMGHNEEIVHVQLIPQLCWPEASEDKTGASAATCAPSVSADRFVCIANDEHPRVVNCKGFGASLLRGHTDVVISCDVSPDGRWIATGGKDQSVRVWSAAECCCVCVLAGHAGAVSALAFPKRRPKGPRSLAAGSSQPLWLVSGSQDKTMKIWELPSAGQLESAAAKGGVELKVKKAKVTFIAHTKEVNDVAVSPNNKLIASGGHDKLVRIWQFPQGELLGECKGHTRGIWCVAFSPVDQVIASASGDATVRLWNLRDYTPIRAFQGHTSAVLRVCFLASGMQLMTSSVDGLLKLWQIRTADCAATFDEHTGKVWCIDVIGDRMVSGGSDSKLCVWRDATLERAKERHDAQAEVAMKDSKIGLLVREGKIEDALTMALDLNRPGQMRQILANYTMDVVGKSIAWKEEQLVRGGSNGNDVSTHVAENGQQAMDDNETEATRIDEGPSSNGNVDLQRWILTLSTAQLEKLVDLLEQWNSNRRMSSLAQMLMGLLLITVPASKLLAVEGINATCGAILSYSGRHMARVDSLLQKTFLFDLVLQSTHYGLALQDDEGSHSEIGGRKAGGSSVGAAPMSDSASPGGVAAPLGAEAALKRTMDVLLGDEDEEESIDGIDGDADGSGEEDGTSALLAPAPGGPGSAIPSTDGVVEEETEDEEGGTGDQDKRGDGDSRSCAGRRPRKRREGPPSGGPCNQKKRKRPRA